jgi:hypothetical protein
MSLPLPWVERIFEKLTLVYGQAFLRRWADIDLNKVKSDWSHELSGFDRAPKAIAFALANLPEAPPTVVQFKSIARQAPPADVPQLPQPKADPARLAAELSKLDEIRVKVVNQPTGDMKAWARRLRAREVAGDRLSSFQRDAWRVALGEAA